MPALPRLVTRHRRQIVGTAAVLLFLATWQIVGGLSLISADLISYPTQVVAIGAAMAASGELGSNALVTLVEFVYGFLPAVLIGIVLGLILGQVRWLRLLLDPLLMALYTAPRVALIPLLVVWFGVGSQSKVVVVLLSAVFPVIINTMAGVQQIDPLWVRAVQAFGGSRLQIVSKVVVPGSLPAIMAGIRLGLGRGVIGLIIGEMYVAVAGIGHVMQAYSAAGRSAELLFLLVFTATFGFLCVSGLRRVEEWLGPWRRELAD